MSTEQKSNNIGCILIFIIVLAFITFTAGGKRIGCKCNDGTDSYATGSGACSHHGGVRYWKRKYWWQD